MAIKMRYLYFAGGKKKFATIGDFIKTKFDLSVNSVDVIPPAYSCDKERIVILGLALKGDIPDQLRLFCRELTKLRAQNVALIVDGNEKSAKAVIDILKEAGTNVAGDVLYIKGALLPFMGAVSDEEKAAIGTWIDGIVASLK